MTDSDFCPVFTGGSLLAEPSPTVTGNVSKRPLAPKLYASLCASSIGDEKGSFSTAARNENKEASA
jgi:hypothetical protein